MIVMVRQASSKLVWLSCIGMLAAACAGCTGGQDASPSGRPPTSSLATTAPTTVRVPIATPPTQTLPVGVDGTPSATPQSTRQVTVTPTPSSSPAPPAVPTLHPDELEEHVLELLQTNGGCGLPCWWGIVPGQTTWRDARSTLESLGLTAVKYSDPNLTNYSTSQWLPGYDISMGQLFDVDDSGRVQLIWAAGVTVRENDWVYAAPEFLEAWSHYTLRQMVATYGAPSDVLIHVAQNTADGLMMPFQVLLFYADQGILVRYYGPAELLGDQLVVCPDHSHIELWLWPPHSRLTLEDIADLGYYIPPDDLRAFVPFEEAVGGSFADFVADTDDGGACFESPADLWP